MRYPVADGDKVEQKKSAKPVADGKKEPAKDVCFHKFRFPSFLIVKTVLNIFALAELNLFTWSIDWFAVLQSIILAIHNLVTLDVMLCKHFSNLTCSNLVALFARLLHLFSSFKLMFWPFLHLLNCLKVNINLDKQNMKSNQSYWHLLKPTLNCLVSLRCLWSKIQDQKDPKSPWEINSYRREKIYLWLVRGRVVISQKKYILFLMPFIRSESLLFTFDIDLSYYRKKSAKIQTT